jgi:hypothetical protein
MLAAESEGNMKTYQVKPQGVPVQIMFRGDAESVWAFAQGLALGLDTEVTYVYKSRKYKLIGGTGINSLSLSELKRVYAKSLPEECPAAEAARTKP